MRIVFGTMHKQHHIAVGSMEGHPDSTSFFLSIAPEKKSNLVCEILPAEVAGINLYHTLRSRCFRSVLSQELPLGASHVQVNSTTMLRDSVTSQKTIKSRMPIARSFTAATL